MKLIRLSTTDNQGFFDNEFNATINLPANSKIALANLSIEAKENEIIIDSSNDTIYHQYTASTGIIEIKITHGTYSSGNYNDLLNEIQQQANLSISDSGAQIGMQWQVGVNPITKKVNLEIKRSLLADPGVDWILKDIDKDINPQGYYTYHANQLSTDLNTSQMYLDTPFCKGGGVFFARISRLIIEGLEEEDGFYMGLTKTKPSTINTVSVQNLEYAIRAYGPEQTDKYNIVIAGVEYNSVDNPNICNPVFVKKIDNSVSGNNDLVQLSMNKGYMQIKVYQQDGSSTGELVYSQKLPEELYNTDLYPVIIFRGGLAVDDSINCALKNVRYTTDPYITSNFYQGPEISLVGFYPPSQFMGATKMFLQFGAISLATFLGFDSQRLPSVSFVTGPNYNYVGNNQFVITDLADSFVFELLNVNLEAYDGLSRQRRNILSVIPKTELFNGQLIYEANTLIWLDIGNSTSISLRNIKARLLKNDLSKLDINGLAIATILIKNFDE